jgi:hypothetical protein
VFLNFLVSRRRVFYRAPAVMSLAAATMLSVIACDEEEKALTAPVTEPQFATAASATQSAAGEVTTMGTIPLPINQTFNGTLAFGITQTGTGRVGMFRINNASNPSNALDVSSNGSDPLKAAVLATSTGTGRAGRFVISNASNSSPALEATTNGTWAAGSFVFNNTRSPGGGNRGAALRVSTNQPSSFGIFAVASGHDVMGLPGAAGAFLAPAGSRGDAIQATVDGSGNAATLRQTNTTNVFPALVATNANSGWVAEFQGTTKGVLIRTQTGTGLSVLGGSKQAVVSTPSGARELYSEEATEVWFADYGFGKLEAGRARILIDPAFAQTVTLDEPYHVFLQPYGNAELYVEETTSLGFVVRLRDGDPKAKFGYRIVAKRSGFENQRLERAPWADNSSGF